MKFKQLSALALASMITVSQVGQVNAASRQSLENGNHTDKITMLKDGEEKASMCDALFDSDTEISINGDNATVSIYVVDKITMFGSEKEGPQITNVIVEGQNATYETEVEDRVFDKTNGMFGIVAGSTLEADKISFTVPKDRLTKEVINIQADVTGMGGATQHFDMKLENYTGSGIETQSSTVTGTILPNESTYEVTVPETINLGEMNTTDGATQTYEIDVNMVKGNDNLEVVVTADTTGQLKTDANETIDFTNTFGTDGTQTFTQTGNQEGTLSVSASEVAGASAGTTYNGTLNFNITTNK